MKISRVSKPSISVPRHSTQQRQRPLRSMKPSTSSFRGINIKQQTPKSEAPSKASGQSKTFGTYSSARNYARDIDNRRERGLSRQDHSKNNWTVFPELDDWAKQVERYFMFPTSNGFQEYMPSRTTFRPAVDICEEAEGYRIHAEVPGMTKNDVKVSVHDNVLTISGERTQTKEEKSPETKEGEEGQAQVQRYSRVERHYGSFSRQISLPKNTSTDKIKAKCEHGVLDIYVPKTTQAQPSSINID